MEAGRAWVAEIDGAAEAEASTAPGTIRYLSQDPPLAAVTAVSTSLVGRKKGLATQLTALAVANEAEAGAWRTFMPTRVDMEDKPPTLVRIDRASFTCGNQRI
jgi:hypothetical protein